MLIVAAEVDIEPLDLISVGLEPTLEEILDEGARRLKERSTWKLWAWPLDNQEFVDADAFRSHVTVSMMSLMHAWACLMDVTRAYLLEVVCMTTLEPCRLLHSHSPRDPVAACRKSISVRSCASCFLGMIPSLQRNLLRQPSASACE